MQTGSTTILKFLKFACVGGVVFVFDASCFWIFIKLIEHSGLSRILSIALAVTASWWLNRTYTFSSKSDPPASEDRWLQLLKFVLSQLPGAAVNALVSLLVYGCFSYAQHNPWASVAIGSLAGLVINFLMARLFVFNIKNAAP
ncbi:GtrA family protein [Herbaspirillum huttiense]|uniref:GtrA family protein n=1 Tax=Herbaspirillum huttiense TaxID=863372 RepID=UPI0010660625|nr:GtrA family protein [Herbaspirillum huttiense]QBP75429.1 GtrA family protein [Herbaspirillum huttiense]